MRTRRLAVAVTVLAAVAGCTTMQKPHALVARDGVLTHGETLTYVGVDFSHAVFFDAYFQVDDTINGKIPSWSQHALEDISGKFPMPVASNLSVSDVVNKTVIARAFPSAAPDPVKMPLTDGLVRREITPYLAARNSGHALLIVAEQITKPSGVIAHYVVFDRRSGEIILLDQVTGEVGGFGVYAYYLNGLKDVADHARKSVAAITR